jgi:hypothetical protein
MSDFRFEFTIYNCFIIPLSLPFLLEGVWILYNTAFCFSVCLIFYSKYGVVQCIFFLWQVQTQLRGCTTGYRALTLTDGGDTTTERRLHTSAGPLIIRGRPLSWFSIEITDFMGPWITMMMRISVKSNFFSPIYV